MELVQVSPYFCTPDGILVALEDMYKAARAGPEITVANINIAIKEMKTRSIFIVRTSIMS